MTVYTLIIPLFLLPYRLKISKAYIILPITGIRHPFFVLLSCLTGSTWSFSELKDRKKCDFLSVIPHSHEAECLISLSFPQGKADTKSNVNGNTWAWLPSWSYVVCFCLPREAYFSRAAPCWHQAVPHLHQRRCPTCLETGGKGKPNGLWGFIEFKVLLSSCNVSLFPTSKA